MKILSVYNIKGGVGKTATSVNLAYLSALNGYKTLLIDTDPQGASTFYFNCLPKKDNKAKGFFTSNKTTDVIKSTEFKNLDIIPADLDYKKVNEVIATIGKNNKWFSSSVKQFAKAYDHIIIDCAPGINHLTESIFIASDILIVPVVPSTLSVRTYYQLEDYFKQNKIKPDKIVPFFSMVERRKSMHISTVREFARKVKKSINVLVPYLSDVEKMGIHQKPVAEFAPKSEATKAYMKLWIAVRKRLY